MTASLVEAVLARAPIAEGETVLVVDPDGLVRSTAVLGALADRQVQSVVWDEPLESRAVWEESADSPTRALVVDRTHRADGLPADVAASVHRHTSVSLESIFRALDRHVLGQLDWVDLEGAFEIDGQLGGSRLDRETTGSQLLRRLYLLDPDAMHDGPRLLEGLLRLHRRARPAPLSGYLSAHFAAAVGAPLPGIATVAAIHDRGAFVDWLQRAWEEVVLGRDPSLRALLLADGPRQLLDDYFDDGLLHAIQGVAADPALAFGLDIDPDEERRRRLDSGILAVTTVLDGGDVGYDGWRTIAEELGGAIAAQSADPAALTTRLDAVRVRTNEVFMPWLAGHYHELSTLPAVNVPAMVHRAARTIDIQRGDSKVALVVVDGMSIGLWRTILPMVRQPDWTISESSSFAWLPTITSISRQAIFAGRPPVGFADSIGTTSKEAELWRDWWAENAKLPEHEIGYVGLHLRNEAQAGLEGNLAFASQLGKRVLGIVVEDVDHEMHGERLGEGTFHAAIRAWVSQGHLARLFDALLAEGYRIYVTSDHGFTEVEAIGVSQAGVNADKHGRFEVYADELLLDTAVATSRVAGRVRWGGHGLPTDYRVLFAPMYGVLKPKGDRLLSHGGPSIEEVIVPWVVIER